MPRDQALLVHATCPTEDVARQIAASLVEARLAACVSIVPGAVSTYRWQGRIEQESECLLFIKTACARLDAIQAVILEQHPDEVPEIIATEITGGLPAYLDWLDEETRP